MAKEKGLILVDTKYEFGKDSNGVITLIDEIHTPDSSRYFYLEGYEDRIKIICLRSNYLKNLLDNG